MTLVPVGPPPLAVGVVPLLTVLQEERVGWLCALAAGPALGPAQGRCVAFGAAAMEEWDTAALACSRSLPVLWHSMEAIAERPAGAVAVVPYAAGASVARPPAEVAGASLGLAFALAMASRLLGRSCPADLAATAVVNTDGAVGGVDGLDLKIALLDRETPQIARLLVAEEDADEARALAQRVRIVAVRSVAQAIRLVFGEAFEQWLVAAGEDVERRGEVLRSLFALAVLEGAGAVVDWTPVERAAGLALEQWRGLDGEAAWRLGLVRAIAARHEANCGEAPLPQQPQWLGALPVTLRVAVIAQLMQSCADTGRPPPAEVLALAAEHGGWRDGRPLHEACREAFDEQLRLYGAQARLLAVTGDPERALALQRAIADALFERFEYDDLSFQLSEWFRLAGATANREAFEAAERFLGKLRWHTRLPRAGARFVALARARAQVALGCAVHEAEQTLREMLGDDTAPLHLRCSAARWLARVSPADAAELLGSWRQPHAEDPERIAAIAAPFLVLARLDAALASGDTAAAGDCLTELHTHAPGIVGHLATAARRAGCDAPAYVAQFYPY